MSSKLKDARWQLAIQNSKARGEDFFALTHPEQSVRLSDAQEEIDDYFDDEMIEEYASRFNKEDS